MALWRAPHAEVKVDLASNVTLATNAALDTFFSSATSISGKLKNISVVVPEGDVELVNYLGVTSSFQNADLDQKPFSIAELTGTLILGHDEVLEGQTANTHLFFGAGTSINTAAHYRYQAGSITTGDFDRPVSAWLINITDGTDEVSMVLDNALITKYGDVKIDGADGHWEVDVTVKCKPADFYMEWKA
jgi:hypothetical protein